MMQDHQLFILKTDVGTQQKERELKPIFNKISSVLAWNVDRQDIDNVLRVEASKEIKEKEIIVLLRSQGFSCEPLTY